MIMVRNSISTTKAVICAAGMGLALASSVANAGAILKYADTYLGVNDQGHLNISGFGLDIPPGFVPAEYGQFQGSDPSSVVFGLFRNGIGDSTSPGCLCEGWGVAATNAGSGDRIAGYASVDNGGIDGFADSGTFGSTASTATSQVTLDDANVSITHAFGPSLASGVFQVSVTITNNDTQDMQDLVYRRAMDWDIPPGEFDEVVTHGGVEDNLESAGGNVRFASDNGFASVDPRDDAGSINPETENVDFEDNGPSDHGSVFDFAFGDLAAGESRSFNIFYGSTANEADALGAINLLGADVYSLGQYGANNFFDDGYDDGFDDFECPEEDPSCDPCDYLDCGEFDECDGPCGPAPSSLAVSTDLEDEDLGGPISGEPATFLFAFGGVGGVEPGETAAVPVLPFVPAPGEFVFVNPEPRRWFDPPFADGFLYELSGGALFTSLELPPASFGFGEVDIVVGGVVVGSVLPGGTFDFAVPTSSFSIVGLDKILDVADPGFATAFPVFLDFSVVATALDMTALIIPDPGTPPSVSEPATLAVFGLGLLALARRRRLH